MAVLWVEGFEANQNNTALARSYFGGAGEAAFDALVPGRFGGLAARAGGGAGDDLWQVGTNVLGLRNTLVCGYAYRCDLPSDSNPSIRFTGQGSIQVLEVWQVPFVGHFRFELRSKGTTYYQSPAIEYGQWVYVELWAIFESPATQVNTLMRLNGQEVYQGTLNNGANSAAPGYSQFALIGSCQSGGYADMDDFYLLDHAGTPKFFLDTGWNTTVETLFPESAGANQEWTPNGAANNFQTVDEGSSGQVDDDTTYVSGDNDTDLDLHELSDLRFINGRVHAVQASIDARAEAGSAVVDHLIQSRTDLPEELTSPTFSGAYARARTVHQTNPSSGVAFSPMELRDSRIGYGAKENFVTDIVPPDDPPPVDDDYDYGTTSNPSGTPLDFGTTSSPSGPDLDFGTT